MSGRTASLAASKNTAEPVFRFIVLHDDHRTARRGRLVARAIAHEMGLVGDCEIALWNVDLLDTRFGRAACMEATIADVVIVALRGSARFSIDLKRWLSRWLTQMKGRSVALVPIFENEQEPGANNVLAFVERAARNCGRDFFNQPAGVAAVSDEDTKPHDSLCVQ